MRTSAIACLALLFPLAAEARIVNVQSAASRKAEAGLTTEGGGSLHWPPGKHGAAQVSAEPDVRCLTGPHRIFSTPRGRRGTEEGKTVANTVAEHLRYRRALSGLFSGEAFL